ncbi:MAG: hypothetical protein QHH06_13140 [Clostridiales bacterium]|nr:hypothetical protein [Eubacteriales bacterium]MDH7567388.1 hypothetical protein [Clostridiales bacterium]
MLNIKHRPYELVKGEKYLSVNNYVKDHETGTVTRMEKWKPVNDVLGRAEIRIFSPSGRLQTEAVSENLLTDFYRDVFLEQAVYACLNKYGTPVQLYNPFGVIYLTDYEGSEDAGVITGTGNILAYATKDSTYSGSDTKRGTINLTESGYNASNSLFDSALSGVVRLVFDWPTSAGNGTMNTLFWSPEISQAFLQHTSWKFTKTGSTTNHKAAWYKDGFLYYVISGSSYRGKIYYIDYDNRGTAVQTITLSGVTTSYDLVGIFHDGSNWYLLASNKTVYKLDDSFNVLSSFTLNMTVDVYTILKDLFKVGDRLYTSCIDGLNGSQEQLAAFDMTGQNLFTKRGGDAGFVPRISRVMYNKDLNIFIVTDSNSSPDKTVTNTFDVDFNPLPRTYIDHVSSYDGLAFIPGKKPYTLTRVQDEVMLEQHLGKRPLVMNALAAPVNKTEQNTMKVTYTFTHQLYWL